jgi:Nucleotide modification associated domain 2
MGRVYMYVVARDFGFAPNPFHGFCTLATCKPAIRSNARIGDWIIGMGGADLKVVGRCIFAMRLTEVSSFDEYWFDPACRAKRPVRNGSKKMMVGDNIYHRDLDSGQWIQADSHHSNADGSVNPYNLKRDTSKDRVLLSRHFFYFGAAAPQVPDDILVELGFVNRQGHRKFDNSESERLIRWLREHFGHSLNEVLGDPVNFDRSNARYSVHTDRVS